MYNCITFNTIGSNPHHIWYTEDILSLHMVKVIHMLGAGSVHPAAMLGVLFVII